MRYGKFLGSIGVIAALVLGGCSKEEAAAPKADPAAGAGQPAQMERYQEGREYSRLPKRIGGEPEAGKLEIVEFFFYKCPHCYRLQKPLGEWVGSMGPRVKRTIRPAVFSERWEPMAKAFHAMEAAGFDEGLHQAIFREIHEKGVDLDEAGKLFALVERVKGPAYRDAFEKAYGSPKMAELIRQDAEAGKAAMLEGTPTVIVNGVFTLNSATAGGEDQMVPVLSFLAQKAMMGQLR